MDAKEREALAEQLEAHVSARAEELAKTACSADDSAWRARIPELQDAQWLTETLRGERPTTRRWPIVAIFALTAVILTVLLGTPCVIPVSIRATTSDVAFAPTATTSGDVYLISAEIPISTLDFYGVFSSIPPGVTKADGAFPATDWRNLRIEHVYLQPEPKETPKVTFTAKTPNSVRLCVERGELSLDIAGAKIDGAQATDRELQVHLAPEPQPKNEPKESREACVDWESTSSGALSILSNLPVKDLHVSGSELVVAGENDRSDVFPGALKSAQLTFPKAPGLKVTFEREEWLGLKDFSGLLKGLSLSKGLLEVHADGNAARVTRSTGVAERDITPSRLALLRARYSELWFAWGLLIYLAGLVTAFLKWRGVDL